MAFGDKAVGTNHVLPTAGAARYTGGLWVGKFLKTLTYQWLTEEGMRQIAPAAEAISEAEQFPGHALTARMRLERLRRLRPLAGRTALVTGAGRGIGRGCALALAEAGADVVAVSRDAADRVERASRSPARRLRRDRLRQTCATWSPGSTGSTCSSSPPARTFPSRCSRCRTSTSTPCSTSTCGPCS